MRSYPFVFEFDENGREEKTRHSPTSHHAGTIYWLDVCQFRNYPQKINSLPPLPDKMVRSCVLGTIKMCLIYWKIIILIDGNANEKLSYLN